MARPVVVDDVSGEEFHPEDCDCLPCNAVPDVDTPDVGTGDPRDDACDCADPESAACPHWTVHTVRA